MPDILHVTVKGVTYDVPTTGGGSVLSVNGQTGAVVLDAEDVGALPDDTAIPTKVSDLTNDSGFITGYTETDPTVPAWAKAANKPTYTASEVGALPDDTFIPENTSDLNNDSGFIANTTRTVVDPNGEFYLCDASGNVMMRLKTDGLRFYDAEGNDTAKYPASFSFSTIPPYSSRFTTTRGGYYIIGNTCFVNVEIYSSHSSTSGPRISNAIPAPDTRTPLQCIDITSDAISSASEVLCYINTTGYIYMKSMESGHAYIISGSYLI